MTWSVPEASRLIGLPYSTLAWMVAQGHLHPTYRNDGSGNSGHRLTESDLVHARALAAVRSVFGSPDVFKDAAAQIAEQTAAVTRGGKPAMLQIELEIPLSE